MPAKSALFDAENKEKVKIYAIFGGQGAGNLLCLRELSQLYTIYGTQIEQLIDVASKTLKRLALSPKGSKFHKNGFDVS